MQVIDTTNSVSKSVIKGINLAFGLSLLTILLLSFALVNWVAANWAHISPDTRLVLVLAVFIASILKAIIACWRYKSLADYAIQFAALATGALLALVGQIYQTGADIWCLFATWAVLITPWLLLLRTIFITVLWALLLNITVFLYASSTPILMLWWFDSNLWLLLLNSALLIVTLFCERFIHDKWSILSKIFASAAALFLFLYLLQQQFAQSSTSLLFNYFCAVLLLALVYFWFTKCTRDLYIVSIVFLTAIAIASLVVFQLADDLFGILILTIFIVITSVIASMHLLKLWHLWYGKPSTTISTQPWYFYVLRISGLLLAAGLFLTWLLLSFDFGNKNELLAVALTILVLGLLVARCLELKSLAEYKNIIYESALVAVFAGLSLFAAVWLFEPNEFDRVPMWQLLVLGLVVYFVLANFISKFLSASLIVGVCLWYVNVEPYLFDGMPVNLWPINASYLLCLFLAAAIYLWSQPKYKQFLRPLAAALFIWSGILAVSTDLINTAPVWQWPLSAILATLVLSVIPCLYVLTIYKQQSSNYLPVCILFLIASIGMLGAFTLLLGLSLLAFALNFRLRTLGIIAVLLVVAGLPLYYFQTSTSLSFKAIQFAFVSVCLFLAILLISRNKNYVQNSGFYLRTSKAYLLVLLLGAVLIIGFTQYQIKSYQNILSNGAKIILKLAPVDPRSLIQGDYMQLNYAVRTEARNQLYKQRGDSVGIVKNNDYWLILTKDKDSIWNLYTVTDDLSKAKQLIATNPNMVLLKASMRNNDLDWGANSWFFTEGTADLYAAAKYGVLRVNQHGTALISGLLDADLHELK